MNVRRWLRSSAPTLLALAGGASIAVWASVPVTAAESQAKTRASAKEAVREALQREVYGLQDDRDAILAKAADADPRLDAARWHQGQVKDEQGKWVDHSDATSSSAAARRLSEYRKVRDTYEDTAEGQLALANWCASKKLSDQERAHLFRVLDLSPDQATARQRLGFVRRQGNWISQTEISQDSEKRKQQQLAQSTWQPVMQEILVGLKHRSEQRRQKASERLLQVLDPAAIPAMDQVIGTAGETEERLVLDVLRQMTAPEAAHALARHAVFSDFLMVREAAAKMLSQREYDTFMPELLASMYSPVVSRMSATALPSGRIGYRHEFMREGQEQKEVLVLDTEYERVALPGGSRTESSLEAIASAANSALQREAAVARQNQFTKTVNDRILWVLKQVTQESVAADPAAWWNWWNERNEVFVSSQKSINTIQQTQTVSIVDQVPTTSATSSGGSQKLDCLAAGTLVCTSEGQKAIETIRVGDMVLSQHPETGELAYKPVLKTTIRPKGQLIKVTIDGEELQTSGGHLFWVSGEGWVKSRNLQAGMVLHAADGLARVQAIDKGDSAETFNMVVADFNTYFVGADKVLSHDNTVRQPTRAVVPGLKIE
jgi:hypothetical protein